MLALHGLLHLLGYDHHARTTTAAWRESKRGSGAKGGLRAGPDRASAALMPTHCCSCSRSPRVYVGTIETAFSALMRLSLRLMAERGGRNDRLGFYLDDPIQLFVPARLLLGMIFSLATVVHRGADRPHGIQVDLSMLLVFVAVFILVCEHVLPMLLIVRRNPERVLEFLLPPFDSSRARSPSADRRRSCGCSSKAAATASGRRSTQRRTRKKPARRRTRISKRAKSRDSSRAMSGGCCSPSSISAIRWSARS